MKTKELLFLLVPVITLGVFIAGVVLDEKLHTLTAVRIAGALTVLIATTAILAIIETARPKE